MNRLCVMILALTFSATTVAAEAEEFIVRTAFGPESPVVGEKVDITIDVLAHDGWAQVKQWRMPQLEGGYLMRMESQGTRLNERINRESYTGQRYRFFYFPQRDGRHQIPALPLEVSVSGWEATNRQSSFSSSSDAITLVADLPAAARGLAGLVSTSEFNARQTWLPDASEFATGDALKRRVELEAEDLTAMIFTPLNVRVPAGVRLYKDQPVVEDSYDRGRLSAYRMEELTYMMESSGEMVLPDIMVSWWDTDAGQLRQEILPGRSIRVTGRAVTSETLQPASTGSSSLAPYLAALLTLLVLLLLFSARHFIYQQYRGLLLAYRQSEKAVFARVTKACKAGDGKKFMARIMDWLDHIHEGSEVARLDHFLEKYSPPKSDPGVSVNPGRMLDERCNDSDIQAVYESLLRARKNWLKSRLHQARSQRSALPPLNH